MMALSRFRQRITADAFDTPHFRYDDTPTPCFHIDDTVVVFSSFR